MKENKYLLWYLTIFPFLVFLSFKVVSPFFWSALFETIGFSRINVNLEVSQWIFGVASVLSVLLALKLSKRINYQILVYINSFLIMIGVVYLAWGIYLSLILGGF